MSTSASLNRLATSSRCLSIAKNPLLAAQPGIQCPHHRSYATEHASSRPPHAKQAPVPPSLAARLHKSVKHKERARVPLPKLKVPYPAMAVNVSPPERKPYLAVKKHPSHPSNAPQKGKGPSKPSKKIALDEGPAMWRAAAQKDRVTVVQPTWRPPKVKVLPRAENTVPERSAPRRPTGPEGAKLVPAAEYAQKVAWKGKELELGPGFVQEDWADKLKDSSGPSAKAAPPHLTPSEVIEEGTIGADGAALTDVAPISEHLPVSQLAHALDRVLFNPGVHWLQDPRSNVYNFTPWLERIPKVNDFAFEKLTGFVSSSEDDDLRALAVREGKKFVGSTSSLSGMLSHIYFLISNHKEVELTTLSQHFLLETPKFTAGQRMPAAVKLIYRDGVYAIDALSGEYDDPDKNVLTWLGTLLENFLTKTPAEFNKTLRDDSQPTTNDEQKPMREAYRFAKSDKFVMRSQLDCHDSRLPGTGVFDIKTRAVLPIRMDLLNYEENSGYQIRSQYGIIESFEREYYDLIRSGFLKYSMQVRIGNMDGVMVTYHNTERIFGFQYISLDEMDERIYGPVPGIGAKVFNKSVSLLETVLEQAIACYPGETIECIFETRPPGKTLDVFVRPAEWSGEGEKPLTQLVVELSHTLDGESAKALEVLRSTTQKWEMEYKISKAALPHEVLMHRLQTTEARKTRQLVLPSTVSLQDAQAYWESLSYNPKLALDTKEFKLSNFIVAGPNIEEFREVSREGRLLYKELQRRQEGKPKIVLGQGVYEEEESLFFKEPGAEAPSPSQILETGPAQADAAPTDVETKISAAESASDPASQETPIVENRTTGSDEETPGPTRDYA